jgi:hypothetical protein
MQKKQTLEAFNLLSTIVVVFLALAFDLFLNNVCNETY